MMDLHNFMTAVARCERHQRLLARLGLSALGRSTKYPVDIYELRCLSSEARGMLTEFLSWISNQPLNFADALNLGRLEDFAA